MALARGTRKFITVLYILCKTMAFWDSNIRKSLPPAGIPYYEALRTACSAMIAFVESDAFDNPVK